MAPRSRSRSPGVRIEAGDRFRIVGPRGCWARNPGRCTWQPRIYTGRPGDFTSTLILQRDFSVDFTAEFRALEVYASPWFVSVKIKATSNSGEDRDVWINTSKNGVSWIRVNRTT